MPFEEGNKLGTGRPKKSNKAAGMAREHTDNAIKVLVERLASTKEEVQIKAAVELLNRGWGKPQEYVELSSDPDEPLHISHSLTQKLLGMLPTEALQKLADESRNPPDNN